MKCLLPLLLITLITQNINAQIMNGSEYQIEGMTMAITNMERMLNFYSTIFNIEFVEKEMYESKLYSGDWGGLSLLFCPAEVAGNTAIQNRHQFDIVVTDLHKVIQLATKHGGELMGDVVEDEKSLHVGIYDPDQNSILFKQLKK